ncbi:hypothetical protein HAX54_017396 [Datura stramonium]|uniref:Uncharacterized protein n=1 Tax=Datura stramonium TaxID=4076 RepID=A0ABS8UKK9_DATST|nr:hypothetical protein [Datura stramonium]
MGEVSEEKMNPTSKIKQDDDIKSHINTLKPGITLVPPEIEQQIDDTKTNTRGSIHERTTSEGPSKALSSFNQQSRDHPAVYACMLSSLLSKDENLVDILKNDV